MNTFWLKIAAIAVVIVAAIVLIGKFRSSEKSQPQTKEKTFYDQAEKDKEKFLVEPRSLEEMAEKPAQLYFSPLSEIDKIEAERLLNVAVPGRSLGRLPMTGFKLMVDTCRQIIGKWPDSWYAYRAKQLLIDMPPRFRPRYKITQEELDISEFAKHRPGTEPFNGTVEEESP